MTVELHAVEWDAGDSAGRVTEQFVTLAAAQAAIAAAEARGYARGVEDAARWHDDQFAAWQRAYEGAVTSDNLRAFSHMMDVHELSSEQIRSMIPAERPANDAPSPVAASNTEAE